MKALIGKKLNGETNFEKSVEGVLGNIKQQKVNGAGELGKLIGGTNWMN